MVKTGGLWTFSVLIAVVLNIFLFGLMPHLIRTGPEYREKGYENPQTVNFIRIRQKETPPKKDWKERKTPEKRALKKKIVKAEIAKPKPSFDKLKIPFELNPRLPARDFKLPPFKMKSVSVDAPGLKDMYDLGELDGPLTPLVRIPPVYPLLAKRRGIEGWVKIKFMVNKNGHVENISILDSDPEKIFDSAVLQCVSSWRFKPGTIEGIPVNAWAETVIKFELK